MKSIRQLTALAPSIESYHAIFLAPDTPSGERPSADLQKVPSRLEWSGDCVHVIPNRFPTLNPVYRSEKVNAAKLLIYRNLAAFSVVAGAGFEPATFRL